MSTLVAEIERLAEARADLAIIGTGRLRLARRDDRGKRVDNHPECNARDTKLVDKWTMQPGSLSLELVLPEGASNI